MLRVSGTGLSAFARALTGKSLVPRQATLASFVDRDGETIDRGLALFFPAPNSFTGEDVLEIHGHGGPVVVNLLMSRCIELGARLARPGEFTERAFLNGRMDLVQAEAVADLIDAATTMAARSAVRSLQGEFSRSIDSLADEVVALRTLTEATLDFPDEEIDFLEAANAFARLDRIGECLDSVLASARRGNLLRAGLQVVLVGRPNVGKSSLMNRLAGDDLAIVTPIPGTTRDALRSSIEVRGIPLHIIDTAGLRETDEEVERIGIERSWREIGKADLIVLIADAQTGVTEEDLAIIGRLPAATPRLTVFNKTDLTDQTCGQDEGPFGAVVRLSAKTGSGVEFLEKALLSIAGWQDGGDIFAARQRHLDALRQARGHVDRARTESGRLELFAEELRLAHRCLMEITGEFSNEELLGSIFSRFCIGK